MKNEEKKTYQSEKKSYQWTDGEPMHQKMTNFEEKKPRIIDTNLCINNRKKRNVKEFLFQALDSAIKCVRIFSKKKHEKRI